MFFHPALLTTLPTSILSSSRLVPFFNRPRNIPTTRRRRGLRDRCTHQWLQGALKYFTRCMHLHRHRVLTLSEAHHCYNVFCLRIMGRVPTLPPPFGWSKQVIPSNGRGVSTLHLSTILNTILRQENIMHMHPQDICNAVRALIITTR